MQNCTKFGQLILSKIIKIVATSCQLLRLKCTKFDFRDPAGGAYSSPPDLLTGFKGSTYKGMAGQGREKEEEKGKGDRAGRSKKGG